jgi:formylglycine-generating enzyme required for sulfatase activity
MKTSVIILFLVLAAMTAAQSPAAEPPVDSTASAKSALAVQAFQAGDFGRAIALFREVSVITPNDPLVWHFLGQSLEKNGDVIGARKAYEKSLEIGGTGEVAERTKTLLAKLPLPDPAKIVLPSGLTLADWLTMANSRLPRESTAVLTEASGYIQDYGPMSALVELQTKIMHDEVTRIDVSSVESARNALPAITQLLKISPTNAEVVRLDAIANHLLGNMDAAIKSYTLWLRLVPQDDLFRAAMVGNLLKAQTGLPPDMSLANMAGKTFKDCPDCPEMVMIPAGSFEMGGEKSDEKPVHTVTIRYPFALAQTEVTQAQWRSVMGTNPSRFQVCGDSCPVEHVSWEDAQQYVRMLSQKTGRKYRLPSEAEWEYSCRAGKRQEYCGSDNFDDVVHRGGGGLISFIGPPNTVASKPANAWGLYDMSGNVGEWVEDCDHKTYEGAPTDGSAWTSGECEYRVVRGGFWWGAQNYDRAAARLWMKPSMHVINWGVRPVRVLP